MPKYDVTVIIPTTGELRRKTSLMTAINCVLTQKKVKAIPLVVLNGNRYDKALRKQLESMNDIQFISPTIQNVISSATKQVVGIRETA